MSHVRKRVAPAVLLAMVIAALTSCTPPASPTQTVVSATEEAEVIAVVDGDTIDVSTSAGTARVRLIGIDTPEIGRDGEPGECYATEARGFLDDLLYGRTVELQSDSTQADADKYGRLLRHVVIDGKSAAVLALEAGAGYEYTYDVPYIGQLEHRDAENAAAAAGAGLWSACS